MSDDVELIDYVKTRVAEQYGLIEAQSGRLTGATLGEIEDDAKQMARELGLDVGGRGRDGQRRFVADMNRRIREAAGQGRYWSSPGVSPASWLRLDETQEAKVGRVSDHSERDGELVSFGRSECLF